jgi:hypothetical protein
MSRNLDSTLAAHLPDGVIIPVALATLTFKSGVEYVWTGVGPLVYGGNTYQGVGLLGTVGAITEGVTVQADGTTVALSGIGQSQIGSNSLVYEAQNDIRMGAPAKLWFGLMANGAFLGAPYLVFSGTVDKPTINIGADTSTITLALENRLVNLQRPTMRRYTAADQNLSYPTDTGLNWVETLNDIALRWGS